MPAGTTDRVFRFGAFELNEATGELRKHGIRIKLHSQPFQVLVMLLERPAELVTREEMRTRLWGEDTFVDFDHGLNTAVNKVREALGDSASQPRYVETLSGKGYRFIAPATLAAPLSNKAEPPIIAVSDGPAPAGKGEPVGPATAFADGLETRQANLLAAPHELPQASKTLVRTLLMLIQAMYLAFYLGALGNIPEIHDILGDAQLPSPGTLLALMVATAVALIPVRLFLFAAVAFDFRELPAKFGKLFPALLAADLLWALSPFLLIHHVSLGLALGMTAALVYMPFAQRSLILMFARS